MGEVLKYPAATIRAERARLGISQKELANAINTNDTSVSNWEQGVNTPSFKLLVSLADFFGCSLDYLAGRKTEK